jgi:hypothetical protein
MTVTVTLRKSPKIEKKWRATFETGQTVDFGRRGYSDYTRHKNHARMLRYLMRHRRRENWGPSGRYTPGFWSRWLLWSKPSLSAAAKTTQRALGQGFRIRIKN